MEGTSMVAQHKTLADGTGAGVAWRMANPISQAQWVMKQRRYLIGFRGATEAAEEESVEAEAVEMEIAAM